MRAVHHVVWGTSPSFSSRTKTTLFSTVLLGNKSIANHRTRRMFSSLSVRTTPAISNHFSRDSFQRNQEQWTSYGASSGSGKGHIMSCIKAYHSTPSYYVEHDDSKSKSNSLKTSKSTTPSSSSSSTPVVDEQLNHHDKSKKKKNKRQKVTPRLPMVSNLSEFPQGGGYVSFLKERATLRILKKAAERLAEPPTLQIMALSVCATLGIAATEGVIVCQDWPWQSFDTTQFIVWYSLEQVIPSIVWETQDPVLVARSLELDPTVLLREWSGEDPASATILLRTHLLETTRYFVAGFVMIASIFRAANLSVRALSDYEDRIRMGREPPMQPNRNEPGMVIRLCGTESATTEVSLDKMKSHIFPVFEQPDRVQALIWKYSDKLRRPVFWCVREGKYGANWSWDKFPADSSSFFHLPLQINTDGVHDEAKQVTPTSDENRLLILEADATNSQDSLALRNAALDLTMDDVSQGFRRIHDLFAKQHGRDSFRTLRVYLGNSMEIARTGAGHTYTLRHRIRYAKEVDVLIDSRAPVLVRILEWCRRVAGTDRRIFFQTSSPDYFQSVRKILHCYGFEVYDPLDLRARNGMKHTNASSGSSASTILPETSLANSFIGDTSLEGMWRDGGSFDMYGYTATRNSFDSINSNNNVGENGCPMDDDSYFENKPLFEQGNSDMLQHVTKMARIPRLVHLPTTAATVSAVEAMILGGQVEAHHCCAILERQEGVAALEYTLKQKSEWVQSSKRHAWTIQGMEKTKENTTTEKEEMNGCDPEGQSESQGRKKKSSLDIICTSTLYDDLFRQVRVWAKMGFTSAQIQKEMDLQFHEMLAYSHEARKEKALEEINDGEVRDEKESLDSPVENGN